MTKNYQRILTIQDISCVGQCSLTAALPILSACGMETCILPSAVLSTHTAFKNFTCRDLTEDMPVISEYWEKENITFDAFYTGYLGSEQQIDFVAGISLCSIACLFSVVPTGLTLPRMSKPSCAAFGFRKGLHGDGLHLLATGNDHLRDAVAAVDDERLV